MITTNPDGTLTTSLEDRRLEASPPHTDVEPWRVMCGLLAAQIALARLLQSIVFHVRSEEKWIVEGKDGGAVRQLRLNTVTIDSPDVDTEIEPLSAAIIERQPQVFDENYRPQIMRRTWNGHSLRQLSETTCYLGIAAWFAHKGERRSFRAAVQRALLAEPLSTRGGRMIVVPEYFEAQVRLMLDNAQNVDSGPQSNHWTLQLAVQAYVPEIEAIGSPAPMKVRITPDVGVDVNP